MNDLPSYFEGKGEDENEIEISWSTLLSLCGKDEIERAKEELEEIDYCEHEDENEISDLICQYERALAVKEDRLDEYENQYDSDY